jgi:glycosyltransferase involved in cell wall biosynthesis
MNILYHLTILPPEIPECEAISQEIDALRSHFGGDLIYLNPNRRSPIYVPRALFGLHKLGQLRSLEADHDIHHLYNPDPFPFPVLRLLRRPVVYSLTGGMRDRRLNVPFFASLAAVTVADEDSLQHLRSLGLNNAVLVRPGIDTSRFTPSPIPLREEITLMVGSAPWTRAQFRTKGVDALLAAAQRSPRLHLVFLWRGVLAEEMERRVRQLNLDEQVTVLNERADVNTVLAGVHASITLATAPAIVKSYPHSLLESLAAGKPVLVSRAIPMSAYVERNDCGQVVESVSPEGVLTAVEALARDYEDIQRAALRVGGVDFSQTAMLGSFQRVYNRILEKDPESS